jgi:hypothetical protein
MPREENIPTILAALPVVAFSQIDERHRPTGQCVHIVHGSGELEPAWGVAICESAETSGSVLFRCEDDWAVVAGTWHATFEEAKRQAEFEYDGLQDTWELAPA